MSPAWASLAPTKPRRAIRSRRVGGTPRVGGFRFRVLRLGFRVFSVWVLVSGLGFAV